MEKEEISRTLMRDLGDVDCDELAVAEAVAETVKAVRQLRLSVYRLHEEAEEIPRMHHHECGEYHSLFLGLDRVYSVHAFRVFTGQKYWSRGNPLFGYELRISQLLRSLAEEQADDLKRTPIGPAGGAIEEAQTHLFEIGGLMAEKATEPLGEIPTQRKQGVAITPPPA